MVISNYIKLFAVPLAIALAGCERSSVPPYENQRPEAFLQACESILDSKPKDSLKALDGLEQFPGMEDFASSARLSVERRQNYDRCLELLAELDFDGLRDFIIASRASGVSGAELDCFVPLPDAFKALQAYKAQIPFRTSAENRKALDALAPHHALLMKSAAYAEFHAQQLEAIDALKRQEDAVQATAWIDRIEEALISGNAQLLHEAYGDFAKAQPSHAFFEAVKSLQASQIPDEIMDEHIWAVAAAMAWNDLSAAAQNKAAERLSNSQAAGSSGKLLNALRKNTLEAYEAFFKAAGSKGIAGEYAAAYARLLYSRKGSGAAPCLGITEILE